jgi:uncharacterized protein (TIGR02284 family)
MAGSPKRALRSLGVLVLQPRSTQNSMETKNDKTELRNIHDLLVDSRKGYAEAAARVEDTRVKGLLSAFAQERAQLESDVENELRTQDPDTANRDGGTLKGDLHRTWMQLRDSLTKSENANVLAECERGEGYLLKWYDELLKKDDLLPSTRMLASSQRAKVQGNVERIEQLRRTYEKIES